MKKLLSPRALAGVGAAIALAASAGSPAAAADSPAEAANKQVVLDFYAALNQADAAGAMKNRIQGIANKYLSPDYVQHAEAFTGLPGPGTPRDKLVRIFQSMPPTAAGPSPKTVAIMAEGDLVMMLTARETPSSGGSAGKTSYMFNMFRVKDGQLVEHWDVSSGRPGPSGPPTGSGGAPPSSAR